MQNVFNPIPTGQGRNQPLYERHMTKSGRNRVKIFLEKQQQNFNTKTYYTNCFQKPVDYLPY